MYFLAASVGLELVSFIFKFPDNEGGGQTSAGEPSRVKLCAHARNMSLYLKF